MLSWNASPRYTEGYWRSPRVKNGPQSLFAGRILAFDKKAVLIWAVLMAHGKATGRLRSALDVILAAVAQSNDGIVVTDNERDFQGIEIINPLRASKYETIAVV
jgi:toxin FitB